MTRAELTYAIRRGHGRAVQFLRSVDAEGYHDFLVSVCKKNQTHDRYWPMDDYLWRLLEFLPRVEEALYEIAEHLAHTNNGRNRYQIMGILEEAAKDGIDLSETPALQHLRGAEIARLPGIAGEPGLEVAVKNAHLFENWEMQCAREDAEKLLGKRRVKQVLRRLQNADFGKVEESTGKIQKSKPPEDLFQAVRDGVFFPQSRAEELPRNQLTQLCELAFEPIPIKGLRTIRNALAGEPFPLDVDLLLEEIDNCKDRRRQWALMSLLDGTEHKSIRDRVLRKLSGSPKELEEMNWHWVTQNTDESDNPLILAALRRAQRNDEVLHSAIMEADDVFRDYGLLVQQFLLESNRCHLCRGSLAEHMHRRRRLSHAQLEELVDDADLHTQKWAKAAIARRNRRAKAL